MLRYILKRFLISLVTILILVTAVFFLVRMVPGDPFISDKLTPEIQENMLRYWGFDQPLHVQYFRYIGNLLHGDLGISMHYNSVPITRSSRIPSPPPPTWACGPWSWPSSPASPWASSRP